MFLCKLRISHNTLSIFILIFFISMVLLITETSTSSGINNIINDSEYTRTSRQTINEFKRKDLIISYNTFLDTNDISHRKYILSIYNDIKTYDINVPYSIVIAQHIIESGYGKHVKNNNSFGIKDFKHGVKQKTIEHINGVDVIKNEPFKTFDSKQTAFEYHSTLLNNHYNIHTNTPIPVCVKRLRKYATDPYYLHKITKIIERYQLTTLDSLQRLQKYGSCELINLQETIVKK